MKYSVKFEGFSTDITDEDHVAYFLRIYQCTPRIGDINGVIGKWKSKGGRHIDVTPA